MTSNIAAIILFSFIILLSLLSVSIANRIQTRKRVVQLKVKQLLTRIDELEDINASITSLLESTQIPKLINDEIIDLINSVINLAPSNEAALSISLKSAQTMIDTLASGFSPNQLNRVQSSDAEVAKQQYYLNEAGKLIKRHHSLKRIEEEEKNAHIRELAWAHLMIPISTHIAYGHIAASKNNPANAVGHFHKAQAILKSSPSLDERKTQLAEEISELIAGTRNLVSKTIIPELEAYFSGSKSK